MAIIYLARDFEPFANMLLDEYRRRNIQLSEYSVGLLLLSVEAWFNEAPATPNLNPRAINYEELARRIVAVSLEEDHVLAARKEERVVYFPDFMAALVESGKKILDKGF